MSPPGGAFMGKETLTFPKGGLRDFITSFVRLQLALSEHTSHLPFAHWMTLSTWLLYPSLGFRKSLQKMTYPSPERRRKRILISHLYLPKYFTPKLSSGINLSSFPHYLPPSEGIHASVGVPLTSVPFSHVAHATGYRDPLRRRWPPWEKGTMFPSVWPDAQHSAWARRRTVSNYGSRDDFPGSGCSALWGLNVTHLTQPN